MDTLYQSATGKIIRALKQGIVPWRKSSYVAPARNAVSKKAYRGINQFVLGLNSYRSPYYLSEKQASRLGGRVREGEQPHGVVNWRYWDVMKPDKTGKEPVGDVQFLRYHLVFNVEQCDGLPDFPAPPRGAGDEIIARAEATINGMPAKPKIIYDGDRAGYNPLGDTVTVPRRGRFAAPDDFYGTIFHELTHATASPARLGRNDDWTAFGDKKYSHEELVAEMGSALLCARAGLKDRGLLGKTAAYIAHWLGVLEKNPKILFLAASQAQRAADFILGEHKPPRP